MKIELIFPNVAIIVLNYKRWDLTIECIDSILSLNYPNFHIYVVDNDSENSSLKFIINYVQGKHSIEEIQECLTTRKPPIPIHPRWTSPIPYRLITNKNTFQPDNQIEDPKITFIQSNKNLGFAGGNNLALNHAIPSNQFEYYWLFNNDAVADKDALMAMIDKMELDKKIGLCGSLTIHYTKPSLIQCFGGGVYNPKWAIGKLYGYNHSKDVPFIEEEIESKLSYINGASCLVSNKCIREIGLMPEQYFLYFEDLHYSIVAIQKNFKLGFASNSLVYHRESTSSNDGKNKKSNNTVYYFHRNRLRITKQFYPEHLFTVRIALFFSMIKRILRGQFQHAGILLKILFSKSE